MIRKPAPFWGDAGSGFFIRYNKENNIGFSVVRVEGQRETTIFQPSNKYIVPDSPYNFVNYGVNLLTVHVRHAEVEDPDFEYYYDSIYVLDGGGHIVGHFFFRDLAMMIAKKVTHVFKHWLYFSQYFQLVGQVWITRKRVIMSFPYTTPMGIRIKQTTDGGGGILGFEVHPEYQLQNKIMSAVMAYNFSMETVYGHYIEEQRNKVLEENELLQQQNPNAVLKDVPPKYNITDRKAPEWDRFDCHATEEFWLTGLESRLPSFLEVLAAEADEDGNLPDTSKLEVFFEVVAALPGAAFGYGYETGVDEDGNTIISPDERYLREYRAGNLMYMGFVYQAMKTILPSFFGTTQYEGSDSSIVSVWIDLGTIDKKLDALKDKLTLFDKAEGELQNLLGTYTYFRAKATDMFYDLSLINSIRIFWRYGPHMYVDIIMNSYVMAYVPRVEWDECYYFYNWNYMLHNGYDYSYGIDIAVTDKMGSFEYDYLLYQNKIRALQYGLPLLAEYDDLKVYKDTLGDYMIGTKDNYFDYYPPLSQNYRIRYESSTDMIPPAVVLNENMFVFPNGEEDGRTILATAKKRTKNVMKQVEGERFATIEHPTSEYYLQNFASKDEIVALSNAHKGYFVESTDGVFDSFYFLTAYNYFYKINNNKVVQNTSNWKIPVVEGYIEGGVPTGSFNSLPIVIDGIDIIKGEVIY